MPSPSTIHDIGSKSISNLLQCTIWTQERTRRLIATKMKFSLSLLTLLIAAESVHGFAGMNQQPNKVDVSRRESFANVAAIVGGVAGIVASPSIASAYPTDETPRVTSRLGGLLVSVYLSLLCIIIEIKCTTNCVCLNWIGTLW